MFRRYKLIIYKFKQVLCELKIEKIIIFCPFRPNCSFFRTSEKLIVQIFQLESTIRSPVISSTQKQANRLFQSFSSCQSVDSNSTSYIAHEPTHKKRNPNYYSLPRISALSKALPFTQSLLTSPRFDRIGTNNRGAYFPRKGEKKKARKKAGRRKAIFSTWRALYTASALSASTRLVSNLSE